MRHVTENNRNLLFLDITAPPQKLSLKLICLVQQVLKLFFYGRDFFINRSHILTGWRSVSCGRTFT